MGGVESFGSKHPTMGSQHSKHRRSSCSLIPLRALGIVLILQLVGCLIISIYYLRSANREIVWLVKTLYEQGSVLASQIVVCGTTTTHDAHDVPSPPTTETTKSDAMRRFALTGSKAQDLDRLTTQHKQMTAEVDALQKQFLDLKATNKKLIEGQDELKRQAEVLQHKAEELNVERGRLSGELNQALRRVQAAEEGNVCWVWMCHMSMMCV